MNQMVTTATRKSLVEKVAGRFSVDADPKKFWDTLKSTAFRQPRDGVITNEQMMAMLIVVDQYGLNPFTKEIYAFPDKHNGVVPVVGVDGWARLCNEHPQFDGMEFVEDEGPWAEVGDKMCPVSITCVMYRKDRSHPIKVTEYFDECYRDNAQPWKTHPKRMLRHKAMIQAARLAFGFVGIYDPDEADNVIEGQAVVMEDDTSGAVSSLNEQVAQAAAEPAPKKKRAAKKKVAAKAEPEPTPEPQPEPEEDVIEGEVVDATSEGDDLFGGDKPSVEDVINQILSSTTFDELDNAIDQGRDLTDGDREKLTPFIGQMNKRLEEAGNES